MTAGRCPGCGWGDVSCKAVASHMLTCEATAALYATSPDRVLTPEAEYARWVSEDRQDERERAHDERAGEWVRIREAARARQDDYWKKDPDDLAT